MSDMWKTRAPPVPLSFEGIKDGTFILHEKPINKVTPNGTATPVNNQNGHNTPASAAAVGLKDQKTLTLEENLELFIARYGLVNQRRARLDADYPTVQGVLQLVCKRGKKPFHSTKMMMIP
jgi:ubiquitin-like 1-activating enzyme E1 B